MNFYSFERQDEFISIILPYKNGFFLDIACGHPIRGSNTYALESRDWTGIGIDIGDVENDYSWNKTRKAKFFRADATSQFLTDLLIREIPEKSIDYLSLDVDIGGAYQANLSDQVLPRILDAGIKFKCATIEHESFKYGPKKRDEMRNILLSHGYTMLFEGVTFPDGKEWEDWWVNPNEIDEKFLKIKNSNLTYNQVIETLQKAS